jgi:transposase
MKTARRFSREFKQEAVRLIGESGKSVAEIAADLGVSDNSLYRWRQEFDRDGEQAFPGKGRLKADDEYVRHLEQELKVVKQERDILKKAVSIFCKGPNS